MGNPTAKVVSPKGELAWVTIDGEGKKNMNGDPQYVATVVLDPKNNEEHKAWLDDLDAFWEANKPEGRKKPKSNGTYLYDPLLDKDGNKQYEEDDQGEDRLKMDPNGRIGVQFKTGTSFPDGKAKTIKIFNAKNNQVSLGDKKIGNGSEGRLSGAMGIYAVKDDKGKITSAGVTLYLDAIQLTKYVEFVADAGFDVDEDEDGWTGVDEDGGFEEVPASSESKPRL